MRKIDTGSGTVTYETVRKAMGGEPFTMNLTDSDEIRAMITAVNEGIDSHLEACFCPGRGDRYKHGMRTAGRLVLCRTLECTISSKSLPVLLRRLCESELDGEANVQSAGTRLASDILTGLGIDESGRFVGRKALGLT
jgi:hypothetical protein